MVLELFKQFLLKYSEFGFDIAGPMIFGPIWVFVKPGVSSALKLFESKMGEIKSKDEKVQKEIEKLENNQHLKDLIVIELNQSFKELSDDHLEILSVLNKIEGKIDKAIITNAKKGITSPVEYARHIRPIFERRAFDPDVHRYTHGPPIAWKKALNDTRRTLVTGVWKDHEGNILGNVPAISSCPKIFLPLIQAIERAFAYCIADLDCEIQNVMSHTPTLLSEKITTIQITPSFDSNWIQTLNLDINKAITTTMPYSIEEIINAIIHQLNIKVFKKVNIPTLAETKYVPSLNQFINIKEQIEITNRIKDSLDKEKRLSSLKYIYAKMLNEAENDNSKLEESIKYYLDSLKYFESQEELFCKTKAASIYKNLAEVYIKLYKHKNKIQTLVIEYYNNAYEIYNNLGYQNDAKYLLLLKKHYTDAFT